MTNAFPQKSWDEQDDGLEGKIRRFRSKVKIWSKKIFGNIFHRKQRCDARIKGIQSQLSTGPPSAYLLNLNLEKELVNEDNTILEQEESF